MVHGKINANCVVLCCGLELTNSPTLPVCIAPELGLPNDYLSTSEVTPRYIDKQTR